MGKKEHTSRSALRSSFTTRVPLIVIPPRSWSLRPFCVIPVQQCPTSTRCMHDDTVCAPSVQPNTHRQLRFGGVFSSSKALRGMAASKNAPNSTHYMSHQAVLSKTGVIGHTVLRLEIPLAFIQHAKLLCVCVCVRNTLQTVVQ